MAFTIYYLKCKLGKMYVGLTRNMFEQRIKQHYQNGKTPLSKSMHEQGLENFETGILAVTNDIREAQELERHYIEHFDSINNGYNQSAGGQTGNCKIYSDSDVLMAAKQFTSTNTWKKIDPGTYAVAKRNPELYELCFEIIQFNKALRKLRAD